MDDDGDGIDEMWYVLESDPGQIHISHEVDTIKYYFEEAFRDGSYTWTTDVSEEVAQDIKDAYANSMKKWNQIYFYSYADNDVITKHKLINVIEGTASDHNLSIYPNQSIGKIASTSYRGPVEQVETGTTNHSHYSNWDMIVYVNNFYENYFNTAEEAYVNRENTGAHEFGHVLGLSDVDALCDANTNEDHHHEIIMGYGNPLTDRTCNITYKDIAGVAITRGFHTDNDHKWLLNGTQNGKYKLICSVCNGVKLVDYLDDFVYNIYGECDQEHELSSKNMMAVASFGTTDYYKCKYCRYVAPFDQRVPQNYTVTSVNSTYHKYTNTVLGLEYTFLEEHDMTMHGCLTCGHGETGHSFTVYSYLNGKVHQRSCACGKTETQSHSVLYDEIENGRYANCLVCGERLDLTKDNANIAYGITNWRTANGSYILPNGIVVLVEADLESYEKGTLQFYIANDQTQTE